MNRHIKSVLTVLLFVLLLISIYIIPVRQDSNSAGEKPGVMDGADSHGMPLQHVSVRK